MYESLLSKFLKMSKINTQSNKLWRYVYIRIIHDVNKTKVNNTEKHIAINESNF